MIYRTPILRRTAASAFGEDNRNNLSWDAKCKEMNNIRPDFDFWEKDVSELPPGYQKITCHMIFDVKMGKYFRIKARCVADGNNTKTPEAITYSSVVYRLSVRIVLTRAALNGLDMLVCDIHNAYLTADCRDRVWVVSMTGFESKAGKNMMVRNPLYGLKRSGAAFRAFLAETLDAMGYRPSYADQDLWLNPDVKPDGFEYYEYILCYVDNVLCISHNLRKLMKSIQKDFKLKYYKI